MLVYIFEDLIMNPETPGVENLIGKEVYYSDKPFSCLKRANVDFGTGILKYIRKDDPSPFYVETPSGNIFSYPCITPKKEEPKPEPKYVPFKNLEEFLGAHSCVNTDNLDRVHRYLDAHGIWLKEKGTDDSDTFCMVHELWKEGVFVGHAEVMIDDGHDSTDYTSWRELYLDYTFLDGSPCGKKAQG